MSGQVPSSLVGEFVGPGGVRHALQSAVTLVGSGPACDVILPGLAEWHAVVVNTPAGPVLRSWRPAETAVNGAPTAARLLASGDEVTLGDTTLAFVWHVPELVPLTVVPPGTDLAELIDARHRQLAGLFDDLGAAREALRRERAKAPERDRKRRRQLDRLRKLARADRLKAKALARRFAVRLRKRYTAEHDALVAGRATLAADQARLAADRDRLAADRADHQARAERSRAAWDGLAAEQQQFHADRAAALVPLELAPAEPAAVGLVALTPDRRPGPLADEVERLERRAANAAAALEKLEHDRAILEAVALPPAASDGVWLDAVPLDRDPTELMRSLADQDRALAADRTALARAHADALRRGQDLYDARLVVADQLAAVLAARRDWHLAEMRTVGELESVALALQARETEVAAWEQTLSRLDADRVDRARDLWQLRLRLEAWQGQLVAHEARTAADRTRLTAELDARAGHLDGWEKSLSTLTHDWSAVRRRETAQLQDQLAALTADRVRQRLAVADLDEVRDKLHADLAAAAAATLAAGEAQARLANTSGADRRMRVARKRYDQHFARARREVDARRAALAAETAAADGKLRALQAALIAARDREHDLAAAEERAAADRLARTRELDARAADTAAELAKAATAADELATVRAEVDRLAGLFAQTPPASPPRPRRLAA